jgi:signal transduction histidine kinase
VVHGIVESFGASIAVETQIGVGTTFRIFFPTTAQAGIRGDTDVPVA